MSSPPSTPTMSSPPPPPYSQRFFPTYNDEYAHTLRIIKIAQSASRTRPAIFTRLTQILAGAVADPSRGLVSTLPELSSLFNNQGLGHVFERCLEYARFVSDVQVEEEEEEEEEEEGEEEKVEEVEVEVEVEEEKEEEEVSMPTQHRIREVDATRIREKMGFGKILHREEGDTEGSRSRKRQRVASGVLPQRKSVRQWNKRPNGDTTVVLVASGEGEEDYSS